MTPDEYLRANPRPPYVFRHPGTVIEYDPTARCRRCNGSEHLIEGDGLPICRPCIDQLGSVAGDPHVTTHRILATLQERHGDVTRIARTAGHDSRMVWLWTDEWPAPGDFRRLDGGLA